MDNTQLKHCPYNTWVLIPALHKFSISVTHDERDGVSNHQRLLFTQPFVQTQIKDNIKAPRHWPLCVEFTGDRWIPRTKDQ